MDIVIYLLSIPMMILAGYIVSTRHLLRVPIVLFGLPIFINGVDVFVAGDLTTFRQISFALYAFLTLWAVLTNRSKQ